MKWLPGELQSYLNAKEYIDSAVVPILPFSVGEEMKQSAETVEFITLLTAQLERQFTGRIVLFPPFTYLKESTIDSVFSTLQTWEDHIINAGFKHIFYMTTEMGWRTKEYEVKGTIVWTPSIPLEQMSDVQKLNIINSQVKQLLPHFTQKWQENN